jgi:N-acetylmuramoyl-L-alanine amidase
LSLLCVKAQKKFIVVIDPGHGGKDPGCVGLICYEKTVNLSVALQLGELIEKNHKDVNVIYTRKTDVFVSLDDRANIANRNKADLFISIHVNAVKRGNNASGAETYTLGLASSKENLDVAMRENSAILLEDNYQETYEGFDPNSTESYIIFELMQNKHLEQSLLLASEIQKAFVNNKRGDRGVRQAGFLVLRKTSMASILTELGFISNREEEKYLASEKGQTAYANSIYKAFSNYKYEYDRKKGSNINASTPLGNYTTDVGEEVLTGEINIEYVAEDIEEESNEAVKEESNEAEPIVEKDAVKEETVTTASSEKNNEVIYKIQILTSDKKLPEKDKRFKGYDEISFYIEKGIYKYTYGATTDYQKILTMYRKTIKDFKDAFIIRIKDGERVH